MDLRFLAFVSAIVFAGCAPDAERSNNLMGLSKAQVVRRLGYPASISMITDASEGAPGYEEWTYYEQAPSGTLTPIGIIFTNSKASLGRVVTYPSEMRPSRILKMDDWASFSAIYDAEAKPRP